MFVVEETCGWSVVNSKWFETNSDSNFSGVVRNSYIYTYVLPQKTYLLKTYLNVIAWNKWWIKNKAQIKNHEVSLAYFRERVVNDTKFYGWFYRLYLNKLTSFNFEFCEKATHERKIKQTM